jgi:hypothetical protein
MIEVEFELEEEGPLALFRWRRDLSMFHPRDAILAALADRLATPASLKTRSMTRGDGRMCCTAALEATNWELHNASTPILKPVNRQSVSARARATASSTKSCWPALLTDSHFSPSAPTLQNLEYSAIRPAKPRHRGHKLGMICSSASDYNPEGKIWCTTCNYLWAVE